LIFNKFDNFAAGRAHKSKFHLDSAAVPGGNGGIFGRADLRTAISQSALTGHVNVVRPDSDVLPTADIKFFTAPKDFKKIAMPNIQDQYKTGQRITASIRPE
jgi:hypothetical protein